LLPSLVLSKMSARSGLNSHRSIPAWSVIPSPKHFGSATCIPLMFFGEEVGSGNLKTWGDFCASGPRGLQAVQLDLS
jgi:hypothetical protein